MSAKLDAKQLPSVPVARDGSTSLAAWRRRKKWPGVERASVLLAATGRANRARKCARNRSAQRFPKGARQIAKASAGGGSMHHRSRATPWSSIHVAALPIPRAVPSDRVPSLRMLLKSRLVSTLAIVAALYAVLAYAAQRALVWPSFLRLEETRAIEDVHRVRQVLDAEVQNLDRMCADWASAGDMYDFVESRRSEFARANLSSATFDVEDVAAAVIARTDGQVVWSGGASPTDPPEPPIELLDQTLFSSGHPFLRCLANSRPVSGILRSRGGLLLVASRPIVDGRSKLPPRGTLSLLRRLSPQRIAELCRTAHVTFEARELDRYDLPPPWHEARDLRLGLGQPVALVTSSDEISGVDVVYDLHGEPALLLRTRTPREITAGGTLSLESNFALILLGVVLILATTYWLLHRAVVHPINVLTRHVLEIGRSDDLTARVSMDRRDEIGLLSHEFDAMLEKLGHFRSQLADAARRAGMTEIATNVLHDVGNMLNSVRASAHLIERTTSALPAETLEIGVGAMEQQGAGLGRWLEIDPRGQRLVPLLRSATDVLREQQAELVAECASLTRSVDRAADVVRAQQSAARESDVLEPFDVGELLAEAVEISKLGSEEIPVRRDVPAQGVYRGNRHKILRILVNLLNNAYDAVAGRERDERGVTLRARYDAPGVLEIEVEDNGCGIRAEDLQRIFNHGFTTKAAGHGFGLHSCANAAGEMRGSLAAHSNGPGRGSIFTLRIPIVRRQAA